MTKPKRKVNKEEKPSVAATADADDKNKNNEKASAKKPTRQQKSPQQKSNGSATKKGKVATPTKITLGRKSKAAGKQNLNDDNEDGVFSFEEEERIAPKKPEPKKKAAKKKAPPKATTKNDGKDAGGTASSLSSDNNNANEEEDDRAACCLCHCGLDYSGREAFFEVDRRKELEEYDNDNNNATAAENDDSDDIDSDDTPYYQATDPYLPEHLYDPANALVYCDSCNRLYHQKCHFVPLMAVPRGNWNCLVCTTQKQVTTTSTTKKASASTKKSTTTAKEGGPHYTKAHLKQMFQAPPPPAKLEQYLSQAQAEQNKDNDDGNDDNIEASDKIQQSSYHTASEKEWEIATARAKAKLWHKTLTQAVPSKIQSQMSNWRQAQTALETLTRTRQNRQHFLENTNSSSRGSQELAQTLVKLTGAKLKMRSIVMDLESIRANPEFHCQQIRKWCQGEGNTAGSATCGSATGSEVASKTDAATTIACTIATTTVVIVAPATSVVSKSGSASTKNRAPPKSFMERIVFPFGQFPARSIPRTAEIDNEDDNNISNDNEGKPVIPSEIVTNGSDANKTAEAETQKKEVTNKKVPDATKAAKASGKGKPKIDADSDGSSSGVSLDDAKCCICLIGDATDENDLLLCDGSGCCRAYHMECLEPRVSLAELEGKDDEDWFCPLCSGLANCMHTMQSYYMGEEWDHRREDRAIAEAKAKQQQTAKKKSPSSTKKDSSAKDALGAEENDDSSSDDDEDSLKSWAQPDDVFPRAKWEHEAALQLRDGKQNADTKALLQLVLGHGGGNPGEGKLLDYMSDGTDDEELDQHFDLNAFHEDRRRLYEGEEDADASGDDSSHSSAATLVDMSSVELKIGKDELNALSDGSDSESDEGDSESNGGDDEGSNEGGRRSRRLRKQQTQEELPKTVGVDFDPTNIVQGKRRRNTVDYRKLNDALFGELDETQIAKLDDKEDFRVPVQRKRKTPEASSSESEDSDSEGGSDSNNDHGSGRGNGSDSHNDASESSSSEKEGNASSKKKSTKKKNRSKSKKRAGKRVRAASDDEDEENAGSGNEAENDDSSVESNDGKNKKKASKKPPAKKKRKKATSTSSKAAPAKKARASVTKKNSTNGKAAPKKSKAAASKTAGKQTKNKK